MKLQFITLLLFFFINCQTKRQEQNNVTSDSITTEDVYEKSEDSYDFSKFYGVFDHESTTKGFAAILSLRQNGRDLYFTLSVLQGDCKKELEGVVMIFDTTEKFPTGFYQSDNCRLQFTFAETIATVDVKEITFCGLDGAACGFEGSYKKRIN
jgi:hypothetical protein